MSGFGERFRKAGYEVPKPLIEVDGKPIIEHVVNLFPGENNFTFIVNEDHLSNKTLNLEKTLKRIAPTGKIFSIAPHKLGPVNAVLQVIDKLDMDLPTVINYCDFTCLWDWKNFKKFVEENNFAGALPAYKGFHPHSLGTTNYAYIKDDHGIAYDIQEKAPFTDDRMQEYASSGTYYFETGSLALRALNHAVDNNLEINGEYYVSLAYKYLFENGLKTAVYPLQHFMQWGTPEDLAEYQKWSDTFRSLMQTDSREFSLKHQLIMPMAGLGKRFSDEGYSLPKPLIPVSGQPMVIQSVESLPHANLNTFVLRKDMPGAGAIAAEIENYIANAHVSFIDEINDGQARSVETGLKSAQLKQDVRTIVGACDNAVIYSEKAYEAILAEENPDLVVWVARGHAVAMRSPQMFGWVEEENGVVKGVSVKKPLANPKSDPIVIGTMTFRNNEILEKCLKSLFERDSKVNGEYYLDSVISDAIDLGYKVRVFEVESYISWGTPNELKTFEYWQSCFDKWDGHPYRSTGDRWVLQANKGAKTHIEPIASFNPRVVSGHVVDR